MPEETPIPFHRPHRLGTEVDYVRRAVEQGLLVGDGEYTRRCRAFLEERLGCPMVLLTSSCTTALEMAAILCKPVGNITEPGSAGEVVLPGFTFVSTANAFVIHGYRPVFVDVRPTDGNIDPEALEAAITPATRAVVPVHYAGVPCDMEAITAAAKRHDVVVVEDSAQALFSTYDGKPAGTFGNLAGLSFHDTKNISCGEGGALLVNDARFAERAEHIREKGTNRTQFLRGEIDKYTWIDFGGSYLPSELQSAFLLAQLEGAEAVQARRKVLYQRYISALSDLEAEGHLTLPKIAAPAEGNYHLFHIVLNEAETRPRLMAFLKERGVGCAFHYGPLHLSPAGRRWGHGEGSLPVVERIASHLLRLPLYPDLSDGEQDRVVDTVAEFFRQPS